jgi:hypothetical protein
MTTTPANNSEYIKVDGWFAGTLLITFFRTFLGGWMIVGGLNTVLPWFGFSHIFPQPLGTLHLSNVMLVSMLETGLMNYVKVFEVIVGVCLVFNRFVPLALLIGLPIGLVVFYNSIALNYRYERLFSFYMSVWCVYMNIILCFAYIKYYIPMLRFKTPVGKLEDLKLLGTIFKSEEEASSSR